MNDCMQETCKLLHAKGQLYTPCIVGFCMRSDLLFISFDKIPAWPPQDLLVPYVFCPNRQTSGENHCRLGPQSRDHLYSPLKDLLEASPDFSLNDCLLQSTTYSFLNSSEFQEMAYYEGIFVGRGVT